MGKSMLFGWTLDQWDQAFAWYYGERDWLEHLKMDAGKAMEVKKAWHLSQRSDPMDEPAGSHMSMVADLISHVGVFR